MIILLFKHIIKLMKETLKTKDFISDGMLNYGVMVGRYVFESERITVYALSAFPHIGGSDVMMTYQISKQDYYDLLDKSVKHGLPTFPVSNEITDKYHAFFLCGESAYCKRNEFTLDDTDRELAEPY